jgi:hypothetical protein
MSKENQALVDLLCVLCGFASWVSLAIVLLLFLDTKNTRDEFGLAVGCIATTLVVSVIPFQLAPVYAKHGSQQFQDLVRHGIVMCFGSLCFVAATVIRYAFVLKTPENVIADFASWSDLQTFLFYSSNVFFIIAAIATGIGFFNLFKTLGVATFINESNQDGCDPPAK